MKIEYERDFDILTELYNRRALDEHMDNLFNGRWPGALKAAALLHADLDNLAKYVNDVYGTRQRRPLYTGGRPPPGVLSKAAEGGWAAGPVMSSTPFYGNESREELRKTWLSSDAGGETHITPAHRGADVVRSPALLCVGILTMRDNYSSCSGWRTSPCTASSTR